MMKWLSDLQLHTFTVDVEDPEVPERGFVSGAAAMVKTQDGKRKEGEEKEGEVRLVTVLYSLL